MKQLSINNGNAHGTASTTNLALSSFQGVAVQIGHLGLSDLSDLSSGQGSDLVLVGDTGTAVEDCGRQNQQGSRRGLGDEGEAAVSVNSDNDGDLEAFLILGAGDELLNESSDVDTGLTQRRTDRGRRGSLSGVDLKFDNTSDFLCHDKHLLNIMW